MAHCSLPFPNLVFCSHLQCVQCIHYVDEDGYPLGDEDIIFPSADCKSLTDIRNQLSNRFIKWKAYVQFVDSLIEKIHIYEVPTYLLQDKSFVAGCQDGNR